MFGYSISLDPIEFLFVFLLGLIVYFIKIKWISKSITKQKFVHFTLWFFYYLSLVKVVFFPITYFYKKNLEITSKLYYQFSPFNTILKSIEHDLWIQVIGNILLLLPIPVLYVVLKRKILRFHNFFLFGLFLSFSIEIIQLGINYITGYPNKVMDIDDVILNVSGILLGWFISRVYSCWYLKEKTLV
ncbi:VanZ family protein [Bacillus sp. FJAT-25509]|uniref:VanZ family protein n=1 Tax=Bacillus sp. FJAT-25509 TaxID=1712029 RepID=UPI0006F70459|nr:VanZ family protein [Bacillus sp. FJAT-25509]